MWDKMMRGLSTRNYGAVVKDFQNAYGIEKSAVSENFIEASREKVKQLLEPDEVRGLLARLCVEYGFCLPPIEIEKLAVSPPTDIDEFKRRDSYRALKACGGGCVHSDPIVS